MVEATRALGVLSEVTECIDRDQFRRRILDDPLNRQLGRVMSYAALSWGQFDQLGVLLRCGPQVARMTTGSLPGVGEHSVSVLRALGVEQGEIDALLEAKLLRQLE